MQDSSCHKGKTGQGLWVIRLLVLWLLPLNSFAWSLDALLHIDDFFIQEILSKKLRDKDFEQHRSSLPKAILLKILYDPEHQVPSAFKIPPYFRQRVIFWAQIYTQFTSEQVLIHDKNRLAIVYDAIDYSALSRSKLSNYHRAQKQNSMTLAVVRRIRHSLIELSRSKKPKSKHARELRKHLIGLKLRVTKGMSRRKFFTSLAKNIRVQTGQRDKIFQGILNVFSYERFIEQLFEHFKLPRELLAIAFVESSFNPQATSRVGASGVWQIMPFIGKKILPGGKNISSRRNIVLSTLGALHILAQNFKTLKRWDLAVTAYNSGTKHILKAQRRLGRKNLDLATLFKKYRSRHLGFASQNFFAEFLALVYVLKYRGRIFPLAGLDYQAMEKNLKLRYDQIKVYVTKCGVIPQRLYAVLKKSSPRLAEINNHLKTPEAIYPRGTVLMSDIPLMPKRYYQLSALEIRKNYPKNYRRLIKHHKCHAW